MSTSTAASTSKAAPPSPPSDFRARLPHFISRFLGYRSGPSTPIPPFSFLRHIPLQVEVWLFGLIGSFVSMLLIQSTGLLSPTFTGWDSPSIIVSFGASAVLVFGVVDSPLAQPQNLVMGQFLSALVGVIFTKLFITGEGGYQGEIESPGLHAKPYVNGALSMAVAMLVQQLLGVTHPPAGATALSAAVTPEIARLGWTYLPIVLISSLVMLGWALIINNLGRKRYPVSWYKVDGALPLVSGWFKRRRESRAEGTRRANGVVAEEGVVEQGGKEGPRPAP